MTANATSPTQAEHFGEAAADKRGLVGTGRAMFLTAVDTTYRSGWGPINAESVAAMAADWDPAADYSGGGGCQHATSDPHHDC